MWWFSDTCKVSLRLILYIILKVSRLTLKVEDLI